MDVLSSQVSLFKVDNNQLHHAKWLEPSNEEKAA